MSTAAAAVAAQKRRLTRLHDALHGTKARARTPRNPKPTPPPP